MKRLVLNIGITLLVVTTVAAQQSDYPITPVDFTRVKITDNFWRSRMETNEKVTICIPTFITPKASGINGKSLVLDLGGTNYRVAIVDFSKMPPTIHPNNGWKKDMSIMKTPGYTREELFKEMADMIT